MNSMIGRGLLLIGMNVGYLDVVRGSERGGEWLRALILVHPHVWLAENPSIPDVVPPPACSGR